MEMERTFIAVKPDGMNRGLLGEILQRFERKGYKLSAIKMLVPDRATAEKHYDSLRSRPFFNDLVSFICSGPICCMVWEGKDVVKGARGLIGETNPGDSLPGTIRGDFGVDIGRNVVHGSDAVETAKREIDIWFQDNELAQWSPSNNQWIYE